jgi:signal transduction histidine kinase
LTAAADRMGHGDLGARVGVIAGDDDELNRLARSFNAMADTVQQLVADVTDKAARAEAANRAKDAFLTSISHELRTPLTGIQSTAELLQQFGEGATPEDRAEFLGTILRESERLGRRIGDALDYAALAGGKVKWTLGRVDLAQVCAAACGRLDSLQELKRVEFDIHGGSAMLQGDREHVTQAVYHLAHNAWTWSPAGGAVDVTVRRAEGGFAVEVADRGPGIRPEDRDRIFDSFVQGGDVLVDKPSGIGIGLKIAKEVALVHGGGIEYDDRPGGGAVFRLVLRCDDRPIDRLTATHAASPAAPAS